VVGFQHRKQLLFLADVMRVDLRQALDQVARGLAVGFESFLCRGVTQSPDEHADLPHDFFRSPVFLHECETLRDIRVSDLSIAPKTMLLLDRTPKSNPSFILEQEKQGRQIHQASGGGSSWTSLSCRSMARVRTSA